MAVTSKTMRSMRRAWVGSPSIPRGIHAFAYGVTLLLAALAAYVLISLLVTRAVVAFDDLRYGRPRTDHLEAFVGHDEAAGVPTHLMAINLNRQIVIFEIPGGDPARARTISGPYVFGADAHLTPATLDLADIDGDGAPDLLLDIRRERIVYLNRDGQFRLPTPEEQALISERASP
jgi:hypothetical protein